MKSLYTMSLFDGFVDSKNYIAYLFSLSHANEYENVKFFFLIVGYFLSNFPMIFIIINLPVD
jgi:hypothetical protein